MSWPARYPGACSECGEDIDVGELIEATDDGYAHHDCLTGPDPEPGPFCPYCFLELPLAGDCGCRA